MADISPAIVTRALEAERDALASRSSDDDEGSFARDGRLAPKSFFNDPFSLLDQMGLNYRQVPSALTYETLRTMGEKNVIAAAVIHTRMTQVASFCQPQRNKYSVGSRVAHKDPYKKLTPSEIEKKNEIESVIQNCGYSPCYGRDEFETFVKKIVRDRLTFDQMTFETVRTYDGRPYEFYHVPADTLRLRRVVVNPKDPFTAEEWRKVPRYVQLVDGVNVNEYTDDELCFAVANPRTDLRGNGYGLSELEYLVQTVTRHLWAEQWNEKIFSQGSTVKGVLNLQGKVPRDQLEAFRRQWFTMVSGVANAWRTPVLNTENLQWVPLQPSNSEMGYAQWIEYLIKVVCAIYLIDPAEINFDIRGGVGQQPMFMTTNEAQQKVSKDRGLQPLLRFVSNHITRHIVKAIHPDFVFEFVGLDAQTEQQAVELRLKELAAYKTLNEAREAEGLEPIENGDVPMNPTFMGMHMQKMQMDAQQQMMPGGGAGGAPGGMPPQGGEEDSSEVPDIPGAMKSIYQETIERELPRMPESVRPMYHDAIKAMDGGRQSVKQAGDVKPKKRKTKQGNEEDSSIEEWEESIHASLEHELQKALAGIE